VVSRRRPGAGPGLEAGIVGPDRIYDVHGGMRIANEEISGRSSSVPLRRDRGLAALRTRRRGPGQRCDHDIAGAGADPYLQAGRCGVTKKKLAGDDPAGPFGGWKLSGYGASPGRASGTLHQHESGLDQILRLRARRRHARRRRNGPVGERGNR